MSVFAAAPFLGPTLGPIIGGFIGETVGWRWVEGVMAIFTGVLWIAGSLLIPETYPPLLLRKRAAALSKKTGKIYVSKMEVHVKPSLKRAFKTALSRPWILLFREPIVGLLSIYMAIIYGTLYLLFGAFPIVYQQVRGWSEGIGGLAFIGIMIGMIIAVILTFPDNKRYRHAEDVAKAKGLRGAPPEARLPPAMVGCVFIPLGMFWFAWTNSPNIHWIVSIIGSAPFGFGMVLVFLSVFNYLIDAYTIYAASVLAANSVLRSLFGAVFPLFTSYMYKGLGIHWASSIPAFLALACVPFPFLFYFYGPAIRKHSKFAREAEEAMDRILASNEANSQPERTKSEDESGPESLIVAQGTDGNASEKIDRRSINSDADNRELDQYEKEIEAGEQDPQPTVHNNGLPHIEATGETVNLGSPVVGNNKDIEGGTT